MGSNLRPDCGLKIPGDRDICLTSEAITNPSSMGGIPQADKQPETSIEKSVDVNNEDQLKTLSDYFEDLAINNAPAYVRDKNKPTASSTPEEIAAWRQHVLNHRETRRRFVFQEWPRDPNGGAIRVENSQLGKMADNKEQIWGATLFDFYIVRRFPEMELGGTYSSGSKLAKWMKEAGETTAQALIKRQEEEADPYMIFSYDMRTLIEDGESLLRGKSLTLTNLPESWPPPSPFHPSAYPPPWPTEPFTNDSRVRLPTLQYYILQSLLPKRLIVHDPWSLLNARVNTEEEEKEFQRERKTPWHKKTDIKHVYNLHNSTENTKRKEQDDAEAQANLEKRRKDRDTFLADPHSRHEAPSGYVIHLGEDKEGPCVPPIFIVLPLLANQEQAEEAHLYIAPVGKIGQGNHSSVYEAELELPRNQFIDGHVCHKCVLEDLSAIVREQDGPNGERRDPKWDMKSGRNVLKTVKKPEVVTTMQNKETGVEETYLLEEGVLSQTLEYEGPFRAIESRVPYLDLSKGPYCKHLQGYQHPLTTKVIVAAKLSIEGDAHLAREAENYQAFPRHFFEHWSGYNIIKPIHDPVPVGPIVPQFYGYYVVDEAEERRLRRLEDSAEDQHERGEDENQEDEDDQDAEPDGAQSYLSPILLLEHCGSPINPTDLSDDDKNESGSLIHRFHQEDWIHGSIAKRNILRQPGPLNAPPLKRLVNAAERGGYGKDWSFRLIDFGRSYKLTEEDLTHPCLAMAQESTVINLWLEDSRCDLD